MIAESWFTKVETTTNNFERMRRRHEQSVADKVCDASMTVVNSMTMIQESVRKAAARCDEIEHSKWRPYANIGMAKQDKRMKNEL